MRGRLQELEVAVRVDPAAHTKGSIGVELIAWLFFLVPGLLYSLWRLSSRTWVCFACGSEQLIPLDSPKARAALGQGK